MMNLTYLGLTFLFVKSKSVCASRQPVFIIRSASGPVLSHQGTVLTVESTLVFTAHQWLV